MPKLFVFECNVKNPDTKSIDKKCGCIRGVEAHAEAEAVLRREFGPFLDEIVYCNETTGVLSCNPGFLSLSGKEVSHD